MLSYMILIVFHFVLSKDKLNPHNKFLIREKMLVSSGG